MKMRYAVQDQKSLNVSEESRRQQSHAYSRALRKALQARGSQEKAASRLASNLKASIDVLSFSNEL